MTRMITEIKAENNKLKNRISDLEKENEELKKEIKRLHDSIAFDYDP